VVTDDAALRAFAVKPAGVEEAIRRALEGEPGETTAIPAG